MLSAEVLIVLIRASEASAAADFWKKQHRIEKTTDGR
jgi:hypothetical protein